MTAEVLRITHFPFFSNRIHMKVLFLFALTANCGKSQEIQSDNSDTPRKVYPLPEISIKLKNGTMLETLPNSPVKLLKSVAFLQLTCTADYPIKWEYLVKNKTIPILDVVYRRLIRNTSDFDNPKRNRFMSMITLQGLLESQTGKYVCRLYDEKLSNNSYSVASHFDIFIPGNHTFNTLSSVTFMNKTAPFVNVHCPVTDPDLHVRLFKLNEQHYKETGGIVWKPIYANYEPTDGFRLLYGLGRELLGTYNCTADNGASMVSVVADPSEMEHYEALSASTSFSVNMSCWENYKFMEYIRSRRLECFCQDSLGLFMNENYVYENRRANCSSNVLSSVLEKVANCSDWRVEEFIRREEDSQNVCFQDGEVRTEKFQGDAEGTGSRPSIKVSGKTFPNGTSERDYPFTKLNITYNGFVNWAGDFMLAVCRINDCKSGLNQAGNTFNMSDSELEFIETEPTKRQYFPLAHHQVIWSEIIINGTDIKSVYVLQAHSLSYAWFPYATSRIDWGRKETSNGSVENPFDAHKDMSTSTSSYPTFGIMRSNYLVLSNLLTLFSTVFLSGL